MTVKRLLSIGFAAILLPMMAQAQLLTHLGNVLTCQVSKGCTEEVADGHRFLVLQTQQYLVRVAIQPEGKYFRADVMLENRTPYEVHINPSEFRIELTEPKFKRLSYIEPAKLKLPKHKGGDLPRPVLSTSFMAAKPEPVEEPTASFLMPTTLSPDGTVTGVVYFERAHGTGISLLLPISGSIFEFPYEEPKN